MYFCAKIVVFEIWRFSTIILITVLLLKVYSHYKMWIIQLISSNTQNYVYTINKLWTHFFYSIYLKMKQWKERYYCIRFKIDIEKKKSIDLSENIRLQLWYYIEGWYNKPYKTCFIIWNLCFVLVKKFRH